MKLTSTAFADGEKLPKEFAKMGANRIPPLKIEGVPGGTKSLAVIMHDPDAPMAGGFYHWTLWNIPSETTTIGEGEIPACAVEGKTITEQAEQVMKNLKAVLEAAGSDFTKAVKTLCFLKTMNDFAAFNEVYAKYFTGKPARSCVAVVELPKDVLVEVEVVAQAAS